MGENDTLHAAPSWQLRARRVGVGTDAERDFGRLSASPKRACNPSASPRVARSRSRRPGGIHPIMGERQIASRPGILLPRASGCGSSSAGVELGSTSGLGPHRIAIRRFRGAEPDFLSPGDLSRSKLRNVQGRQNSGTKRCQNRIVGEATATRTEVYCQRMFPEARFRVSSRAQIAWKRVEIPGDRFTTWRKGEHHRHLANPCPTGFGELCEAAHPPSRPVDK